MKSTALYIEVYNKILAEIRNGEYPENLPLPAERFLCNKYHVSRSTLRAALNLLNKEDVVYTVPGAGTYIQPTFFVQPLNKLYSFGEIFQKENIHLENDIVNYNLISLDQNLSKKTKYPEGSIFHKIVRLRSTNDSPLMLEYCYLPQNRFYKLDFEDFVNDSMYAFLRKKYNFNPERATETFRPIIPLPHEKELLQIYGNVPCMLVERFTYEDGVIVEYTKSIIRGDKYLFRIDLEQE